MEGIDPDDWLAALTTDDAVIERAALNDTEDGRQVAATFIAMFGTYIADEVRPLLRAQAERGEEPQLTVNGLAELLRTVAAAIELPLDHPRAGSPRRAD